ncbi:MAG: 16S rRNA (guanine(527)-N(7))-methyltransferase RsmG [Eubacteriales bacterium]|nr:16S rRNA (guanine(527)-N(7))-methyltransferase RsmG [Eubacteriales bacterium]
MGEEELLIRGAESFGVELDEEQVGRFFLFMDMLEEWNKHINLTAIEDRRDIIVKHFVDSLSLMPYIMEEYIKTTDFRGAGSRFRIADVGSGAGFPGIPAAIALERRNCKTDLIDALAKRVKFLEAVIGKLGYGKSSNISISNSINSSNSISSISSISGKIEVEAIHLRAEDAGKNLLFREQADIAAARAVATLPVLAEYCLPLVREGGIFIAMKGPAPDADANTNAFANSNAESETGRAVNALRLLGGEIEKEVRIKLPFSDFRRTLYIVRKTGKTPPKYPRRAGKPEAQPL